MHELVKLCIPGIVGGIIGSCLGPFLQHKFAQRRDREARDQASNAAKDTRKRAFIAFLKQWRSELSAFLPPAYPFGHGIFQEYQSKLHEFQGQIALLANDFAGNKTFERLGNRLSGLNQQDMTSQNKAAKDIILEAIDQLIAFVEHN
jgi:hypothetical protein